MTARPGAPLARGGRGRPVWLATPGRGRGLDRTRARVALAAIVLALLAALVAAGAPSADPIDAALPAMLADGVRHGGDYYAVAADGAPAAGLPLSLAATPLPTLSVLAGRVPAPVAAAGLALLAVGVVLAWYARFGGVLVSRQARVAALLLLLLGLAVALRPGLAGVPEAWAGLLVALALARRAPDRVVEPVALAVAAAMLTPAALPFAAVMAVAARGERRGREAAAWAGVLLAGALVLALHARALALVAPVAPFEVTALGPGATLAAFAWATGLRGLPLALGMPLTLLAAVGWASRREGAAARVAASILVQAGLVAALDAPDAALVVAPLLPLGLLAIPDGARDLLAAALDRRRITVTRVTR